MGFAERWSRGCKRFRWPILVWWGVVVILGLVYGVKFLDATVSDFPAPAGSAALEAQLQLLEHFPEVASKHTETLLVQATNGEKVAEGQMRQTLSKFSFDYEASVQAQYGSDIKVISYYLLAPFVPELAAPLLSSDGTATTLLITYDKAQMLVSDKQNSAFLDFLVGEARRLLVEAGVGDQVDVGITGLAAFGLDINRGVKADARTMDSLVLPLALLILALVIHNLPLMILPLVTIPVTLLAQFVVMYPVALKIDVVSFAPTVMISLTIAMGIDYTLFLLTRFMDGQRMGLPLHDAVELMIESAGYIILVSGSTLCVSFLGLVLLPMEILRSMGLGASIAIAAALIVNLTLVPALLFTIGPWLLQAHNRLVKYWNRARQYLPPMPKIVRRFCGSCSSSNRRSRVSVNGNGATDDEEDGEGSLISRNGGGGASDDRTVSRQKSPAVPYYTPLSELTGSSQSIVGLSHSIDDEDDGLRRGCWLDLATFLVAKRWRGGVILVAVLALFTPVILQIRSLKASVEFDLMLPYGSGSYTTLADITHKFGGPGMVFPFRLIMVDRSAALPDGGFITERGYDIMTHVVHKIVKQVPNTSPMDFSGLVMLDGQAVTYDDMMHALNATAAPGTRDFTLQQLANGPAQVVTKDGRATYLTVALKVDPYSGEGQQWLERARDVLSSVAQDLQVILDRHTQHDPPIGYEPIEHGDGHTGLQQLADIDAVHTPFKLRHHTEGMQDSTVGHVSERKLLVGGNSGRQHQQQQQADHGWPLGLHIEGSAAVIHDAVDAVLKDFPIMISITLAVVFLLIGLAFKSVVAPLRSVLTIGLTLGFVYGLAVAVYQGGILDWTGWRAFSKVGSVAWLPIVMCFSIIVGLGLDYDVFLVTRVLEYRMDYHTDRSALVRGMVSTGHIITAAGVIMAVAFSGLLFSSELVLNQTAFLLCISVLLDTFLVRSLLVPILMTFTDRYTWWPRRDLPPPTKDYQPHT